MQTSEILEAYRANGYAVVENALRADECGRLAAEAATVCDGASAATELANLPYRASTFTKLLFHPALLDAIGTVLGENIQYWSSRLILLKGTVSVAPDTDEEATALTCVIPLGDVRVSQGPSVRPGAVLLTGKPVELAPETSAQGCLAMTLDVRVPDSRKPVQLVPGRGLMLRGHHPDFLTAQEFRR